MSALGRQKIPVETMRRNLIVYTEATEEQAISMARDFREKGRSIELLKREPGEEREVYESYGKRTSAAAMLYLRHDQMIEMVNLNTGEERIVDTKNGY